MPAKPAAPAVPVENGAAHPASRWGRVARPDRRTLHKALRVAVVVTVAFLFNLHVLGEPQAALFGALGPIGLLATADFGGPAGARLRAYLVTLGLALVVVTVGTLLSERTDAATVAMLVIAFVVSFGAVAGRNAAGGATAVILFYVVACAIPVGADELVPRLTGLLIAGGLSIAGAMLLWPDRPGRDFRARLSEATGALAAVTGRVAAGERFAAESREAQARLAAVRPYAGAVIDRPAGTTAADAAEIVLVHALDRVEVLLRRLGAAPQDLGGAELEAAGHALLQTVASALAGCGAALERGAAPPAPGPVLDAREAHRRRSAAALAEALARGTDGNSFKALTEYAFARRELATATVVAVAHARVALGVDRHLDHAALPAQVAAIDRRRRTWLRIRNNLTLDSVLLRNSLRLAVAAARRADDVFAAWLGEGGDRGAPLADWSRLLLLSHGFWYSTELMGDFPEVRFPRSCPALAAALATRARHTDDDCRALAATLRDAAPAHEPAARVAPDAISTPGAECVRGMAGSDDQPELAATVRVFVLRAWLVELDDRLDAARPLAARLAPA